jgi:hypothetical protein
MMPTDFPGAFTALRQILNKHAAGMVVEADTPSAFTVVTPAIGPNKKPLWFGCVMSKKSAVTYHLMPLYYNRKLKAGIGPELLARMQGKTCFNFQRPDPLLFAQLDELTRIGREQWERFGFLEPGPVSPERLAAALTVSGEDPAAIARRRKKVGAQAAAKRAATLRKKRTPAGRASVGRGR